MKTTFVLLLFACLSVPIFAQQKIIATFNPGLYLFNSENSLKTIGNESLGWAPGFSIAYERQNIWGLDLRIEYSFVTSEALHTLDFIVTGSNGPEPIDSFDSDLFFASHALEIDLCYYPTAWLVLSAGPSFVLTSRSIELRTPPIAESPARSFDDRLVTYGLGAGGGAAIELPFSEESDGLEFVFAVKVRYFHSVFFDKRGRDVGNYHQSALIGQLQLGLGYRF